MDLPFFTGARKFSTFTNISSISSTSIPAKTFSEYAVYVLLYSKIPIRGGSYIFMSSKLFKMISSIKLSPTYKDKKEKQSKTGAKEDTFSSFSIIL